MVNSSTLKNLKGTACFSANSSVSMNLSIFSSGIVSVGYAKLLVAIINILSDLKLYKNITTARFFITILRNVIYLLEVDKMIKTASDLTNVLSDLKTDIDPLN